MRLILTVPTTGNSWQDGIDANTEIENINIVGGAFGDGDFTIVNNPLATVRQRWTLGFVIPQDGQLSFAAKAGTLATGTTNIEMEYEIRMDIEGV